jgi:MFS family permease
MSAISLPKTETNEIHWKQLWSLTALYSSIIIGWIAYQNYQPKLLIQFGFTDFAFFLAVSQAIILVFTPPISGIMGDRFRFEKGHRLPIISSGISFAAMIFMAVAFTLFTNPGETLKWLLPVLIVLWLIAMSIFTSPALSTVELFTPVDRLPKAMALLTIVANLIYAIEPVIVDIIDYLGAPITFITGGVVTLLSGYAMKKNSLGLFKQNGNKEISRQEKMKTSFGDFTQIFVLGLILGIATVVLFELFPDVIAGKISAMTDAPNSKLLLVGMLVFSAILSWPISTWINNFSMSHVFWASCFLAGLTIFGVMFFTIPWMVLLMATVFVVAFTAMSVSSLPLALDYSGFYQKVFCVGIFFAGVALPDGILDSINTF